MAWPDTARKRLTYIMVAPLLIPMWLTLPDTRTPRGKKYYPVTFIGSILWIAAFSYLMVWWANVAGDTARIPPEVSCEEAHVHIPILLCVCKCDVDHPLLFLQFYFFYFYLITSSHYYLLFTNCFFLSDPPTALSRLWV